MGSKHAAVRLPATCLSLFGVLWLHEMELPEDKGSDRIVDDILRPQNAEGAAFAQLVSPLLGPQLRPRAGRRWLSASETCESEKSILYVML